MLDPSPWLDQGPLGAVSRNLGCSASIGITDTRAGHKSDQLEALPGPHEIVDAFAEFVFLRGAREDQQSAVGPEVQPRETLGINGAERPELSVVNLARPRIHDCEIDSTRATAPCGHGEGSGKIWPFGRLAAKLGPVLAGEPVVHQRRGWRRPRYGGRKVGKSRRSRNPGRIDEAVDIRHGWRRPPPRRQSAEENQGSCNKQGFHRGLLACREIGAASERPQ
jgi:hypothetical protein